MEKIIPCFCLTCGVRNDFKHPDALCPNGHDDWFELRDFTPEAIWEQDKHSTLKRAKELTGMSTLKLYKFFMNTQNLLLPLNRPKTIIPLKR